MSESITHAELVKIGAKFLKNFGCSIVLSEMRCFNNTGEIADVFALKSGYSIVVECKTSRADFFADRKKPFRQTQETQMGQYRCILCPENIITVDDLVGVHENWWLLHVKDNRRIKRVVFPKGNILNYYTDHHFKCNLIGERSLLASALRRSLEVQS